MLEAAATLFASNGGWFHALAAFRADLSACQCNGSPVTARVHPARRHLVLELGYTQWEVWPLTN